MLIRALLGGDKDVYYGRVIMTIKTLNVYLGGRDTENVQLRQICPPYSVLRGIRSPIAGVTSNMT